MDNPKTIAQGASTPELMTARGCKISDSQRTAEVLKLHKNSMKDDQPLLPSGLSRPQECNNGTLPVLLSQHVQTHVNHANRKVKLSL
jgi:hypothetical protein